MSDDPVDDAASGPDGSDGTAEPDGPEEDDDAGSTPEDGPRTVSEADEADDLHVVEPTSYGPGSDDEAGGPEATADDGDGDSAGDEESTADEDDEGATAGEDADDSESSLEDGDDGSDHAADEGDDEPEAATDETADATAETDPDSVDADEAAADEAESSESDDQVYGFSPEDTPGTAEADGGATGTAGTAAAGAGTATIDDDPEFLEKPPDDEEMPLTEHIEEMLSRLAKVLAWAAIWTAVALPASDWVLLHLWYDVHPGSIAECLADPLTEGCTAPHVYGPLEFLLTRLRVAGLAGLIAALPVAVYQTYRFMRPGLYPHERRYYLAAVPFSLVLGVVGVLFAYAVILPLLFTYFVTYTEGSAELAFQLADTMNLILIMMGLLALIFQIPLMIMLAIMMGITSRQWLARRRIYFWGLFVAIAFFFGPDPTGMAPVLLTATMVVLFEATLLLLRWTGR